MAIGEDILDIRFVADKASLSHGIDTYHEGGECASAGTWAAPWD